LPQVVALPAKMSFNFADGLGSRLGMSTGLPALEIDGRRTTCGSLLGNSGGFSRLGVAGLAADGLCTGSSGSDGQGRLGAVGAGLWAIVGSVFNVSGGLMGGGLRSDFNTLVVAGMFNPVGFG
jgi:hypothetical protein